MFFFFFVLLFFFLGGAVGSVCVVSTFSSGNSAGMVTAAQKSERNFVTRNAHSCNLLSAVHGCLKLEVPQQTWLPHPILTKQGGSSWHFRYPGSFVSSRHCPCQWSKSVRPLPPPAAHHGRCPLPLLLLCHMSGALPKHPKNVACQNYETTGSLWPPAVWSQKSSGPPDSSAKLENSPWLFVDFLDESFSLPPQHILFWGNNFCKLVVVKPHPPYVFGIFPTRKVGGSDDSSYPNLTTCKSAHMFFSKLSWLKLNHQEFADLLWVDPTRSWTWKHKSPRSCNRPTWSWACSRMEADRPVGKKRHVFFSDGVF